MDERDGVDEDMSNKSRARNASGLKEGQRRVYKEGGMVELKMRIAGGEFSHAILCRNEFEPRNSRLGEGNPNQSQS